MTRCPIHSNFFRTENTPCPACREAFDVDLPAVSPATPKGLSTWQKNRLEQQQDQIDSLNDLLYAAHERNVIYAAIAVVGWAVVVIAGTLSFLGWVQL